MKFRSLTLRGVWTCERCGDLARPLQISPLAGGLNCLTCGNALVFVPEFKPVELESGMRFFAELKTQLSCRK